MSVGQFATVRQQIVEQQDRAAPDDGQEDVHIRLTVIPVCPVILCFQPQWGRRVRYRLSENHLPFYPSWKRARREALTS